MKQISTNIIRPFTSKAAGLFAKKYTAIGLLVLLVASVVAQVPNCANTVPTFNANFVNNPGANFTFTNVTRNGSCCGSGNCVDFVLTLDSNTAAVNLAITSGAIPSGSLFYQLSNSGDAVCGPQTTVSTAVCVTNPTHTVLTSYLTFCKPGNNSNSYTVTSIAKPTFKNDTVALGCSDTMRVLGVKDSAAVWTSVFPGTSGQYNSLLSCTNCARPVFTPLGSTPSVVKYIVCGYAIANACVGNQQYCDTVTVYVTPRWSTVADQSVCSPGTTTSLGAAPSGSTWTLGPGNPAVASINSSTGAITGMTTNGTYTFVLKTNNNLCTDTVLVTRNGKPNAGLDQGFCQPQTSASLGAAPGGMSWSAIPGNPSAATVDPSTGNVTGMTNVGTYLFKLGSGGCSDTVAVSVFVNNTSVSPDTTICKGTSVQLNASGAQLYSWSPGNTLSDSTKSNPIATPATTTTYTVTGYVSTGNLVVNGDFQQGNVGFSSSYTYISPAANFATSGHNQGLVPEGDYAVDSNANNYHPSFFGHDHNNPPHGKFMIVNGAPNANVVVWSETVSVIPNTTYFFSTWVSALNLSLNLADLKFSINNSQIGPIITSPHDTTSWIQFYTSWNSGVSTTAVISIVNQDTIRQGNDFGLDDISFTTVCSESKQVTVTINNPVPSASSSKAKYCTGDSVFLTASATGGTGALTYHWSGPGGYSSNVQNPVVVNATLSGVYSVTVTDSKGCTGTTSTNFVTIAAKPTITASSNKTNYCSGDTIKLTSTPTGGTSPYHYSWSTNASTSFSSIQQNPSILNATTGMSGTYTVQLTDTNGCTATGSTNAITVHQSPTITAGSNKTNYCTGDSLKLFSNPVNGATPYSFNWSSTPSGFSNTTQNPIRLNATTVMSGTYTVTVTDNNNCTAKATTTTITVNPSPTITANSSNPQYCAGATIQLNSTPSGGSTPYSYIWSGPLSFTSHAEDTIRSNATTTMSGIYSVTVTDVNGCKANASTGFVTVNGGLSGTASSNSPVCSGGAINLTVLPGGGTAPYHFSWSGPSFTSSIQSPTINGASNANAGTYTVAFVDSNGCTDTLSTQVTVNPTGTVNVSSNSPVCSGDSLGLSATPSGGTAPFSYSWTGPSFTSNAQNPSRLNAQTSYSGTYSVVVTDSNQCISNGSTSVTINARPSVGAFSNSPVCEGQQIHLSASPSGGTPGYSYSWSGPQNYTASGQTPTINNAAPNMTGVYTVVLTDNNGCSVATTTSVLVNGLPVVNAGSPQTVCSGTQVTLGGNPTASGGQIPYQYNWDHHLADSTAANPVINPTGTTTYTVTVTDGSTCSASASVTITVNPKPAVNAGSDKSLASCSLIGVSIGGTPTAGAGTAPYTYLWSPDAGLSSDTVANPVVSHLGSNTSYTVIVTDHNGCTASDDVNVNITGSSLSTTFIQSGPATWCAGTPNNVTFTAIPSGGVSPYTYAWTGNSLNGTNTASVIASPTVAGIYTYAVVVTDSTGCQAGDTTSITVLRTPVINLSFTNYAICNGSSITLGGNPTASGGNAPYTYSWSNGADPVANPVVSPTGNTTYTLIVTDSSGCSASASSTVFIQPSPVADAGPDMILPACSPTGIRIGGSPVAHGGSGSYTYNWSPAVGLSSTTVANPTAVGLTTDTTYTVVVTDVGGCTATDQVYVQVTHNAPQVTITPLGRESWCEGSNTGINLQANVSGGNPTFNYNWSGTSISPLHSATATVTPNNTGTYVYTVFVTDAYNCTATANTTVKVTPNPTANAGAPFYSICFGTSIDLGGNPTATGGTPPYTYSWTGGAASVANPEITPISTTIYLVVITDSNGCSSAASTTVTVNNNPSANAGPDMTLPSCSPTGIQIGGTPTASGGAGFYHYSWSPNTGLSSTTVADPTVTGLNNNTTYTVTVTDLNGCKATDQVSVTVSHNSPQVSIIPQSGTSWCGGTNGSVVLSADISGGNGPFSYTWSGTNINPVHAQQATANPNTPGTYTYSVTITDASNCTATANINITVNTPPVAHAGAVSSNVCSGQGVTLGSSPTATGGTPPYTYSWTGGALATANPVVNPTISTLYTVQVTDSNGCTATANTIVFVRPNPVANAGSDKTVTACSGSCVVLGGSPTGSGGTGPLTYSWSPGSNLNSTTLANPTACGVTQFSIYNVRVTDSTGCSATAGVSVSIVPSSLTAEAGSGGSLCTGSGDSLVLGGILTAVGGVPPYTYTWSPTSGLNLTNPANPTAFPATTTTYHLTITDFNGCPATDSTTVKVHPGVIAHAGSDTSICLGFAVTLGGQPTATGGTPGFYHYSWNPTTSLTSNLVANPVANPAVSTVYVVLVTDSNGCSASSSVAVNVRPSPSAFAGPDQSMTSCLFDSVRLGGSPAATGGTPGYSYKWTPATGLTSDTIANPYAKGLNTTTLYILTVTDATGCSATDQVLITVNPSSLTASAGNGGSYCAGSGGSVTLDGQPTASGGTPVYTYTWSPALGLSPDSMQPNPIASPVSTTTYNLTVSDARGCSATSSATVTVNPTPVASAGADTSVCQGISVQIGGSPSASGGTPGYHYQWNPTTGLTANNIANPVATPQQTTTYTLSVTDSKGCSSTSSMIMTVRPNPVADAGQNVNMTNCTYDTVTIGGTPTASGGTPGYSYNWSPATGLSSDTAANPDVTGLLNTTLYSLTVTDVTGCSAAAEVIVKIVPSGLTVNAGSGGTYCSGSGGQASLGGFPTASGGTGPYTYNWSPAGSLSSATSSNPFANPDTTTTYHVTVTDSKGCSSADSVTVTVRPTPTANAGADTTICAGMTVALGGTPTASGGSTQIYSYSWTPVAGLSSAVAANPTVSPTITTTYTVTVTNSNACSATATVTVTVHPNPTANAGPTATLFSCSSDSVKLGGTPAASGGSAPYTYSWSPAGGLSCSNCANPFVSHLATDAVYTLIVTDSFGCSASSQVAVHVSNSSMTANAGNNSSYCFGSPVAVPLGGIPTVTGGTGPYTYSWSPAAGISDSTKPNPTASPVVTTTYTVVVTDSKGCIAQDTVRITVNPLPVVNAGGPDTVCAGTVVTLGGSPTATSGTGPYTYHWSPGLYLNSVVTANPVATPQSNLTYELTVTDSVGCSASATVAVKVNQNPVANAGGNTSVSNCQNACVTLGGTPTATYGSAPYLYAWAPQTGLNNTGLPNPTACGLSVSQTYTLTVTDFNGCTATAEANVNVTPSSLVANAGPDRNLCANQPQGITIGGVPAVSGGVGPYNITWSPTGGILNSNTIQNPTVDPNNTTQYILFVQDAAGCTAIDSMIVFADPPVTAAVHADTSICSGSSVNVGGNPTGSGGTAPYAYTWAPGNGLSGINIPDPTATPLSTSTYCVTVTDLVGCSASTCITINVNPAVVACAGPSGLTMTNCPGATQTLGCAHTGSGGTGNYSYHWAPATVNNIPVLSSSSTANPVVTGLTTTTTFSVTVTDLISGCSATDQVTVKVNPSSLAADAGPNKNYCAGNGTCVNVGGLPTGIGGFPFYTFQWTPVTGVDDPTSPNPCITAASTTTYTVMVTDQLGCVATDSVRITVSPAMNVNAGRDTVLCYGSSVQLGGNPVVTGGLGNYTYNWSPSQFLTGTTIPNPVAQNVTSNITYTLIVTDELKCTGSASIIVATRPLPVASAGPAATIYACAPDSVVIGGTPTATGTVGPYTYQWSPPFDQSLSCGNCANPVVKNLGHATQFCVTVGDAFGCQSLPSCTQVTVLPNTVFAKASNGPISVCANASTCVTLGGIPAVSGGVPAYTYQWFGGNLNGLEPSNPTVCPDTTTLYILIGTDSHGCQAADSVTVTVNPAPVATISGLAPAYCVGAGNVSVTGSPAGGTFSGSNVIQSSGNTAIFQPGVVGVGNWCIKYSYTNPVTGCKADTTVCVNVYNPPHIKVTGFNPSYCQIDTSIHLIGNPAGGIFSGPGVSEGNIFNPANADVGVNQITYTYNSDTLGCGGTLNFNITINRSPTLTLTASMDTACAAQALQFIPSYSFDVTNIIWSKLGGGNNTSGLSPVTVFPSGSGYCEVAVAVNANSCTAHDTLCVPVMLPPVIRADTANTCEQQPVAINVLNSVNDPQGHSDNVTILTAPGHGTLVNSGTGVYTYTPTNYYYGVDSFTYASCNTSCTASCDTGKMYIAICYIHFPPVITDTTITMYEYDTVHVCPNIYDVNSVPLTIGNANCTQLNGTVTFTSDSCFNYAPTYGFTGTQVLCITVCDTLGLCDTGTVTIIVIPGNQPPLTNRIVLSTCKNEAVGVNVASAVTDPLGDPLTYTYGTPQGPEGSSATWMITGNGAAVFNATMPGTYTIPYTACNHSNLPINVMCSSNVIVVQVINCDTAGNDSIKANNDGVVTGVGMPALINELANDYYPNPGQVPNITILVGPHLSGATYTVNLTTGQITYNSPTPGLDSIVYQICDPAPLCSTATIYIYVDTNAVFNYPPVAVDDFDSTAYGTPVNIPVLHNDYSNDGDSIVLTAIPCQPDQGTVMVLANGTITYIPNGSVTQAHSDTFCYKICDAGSTTLCDTAQVVIYVKPFPFFPPNDTEYVCKNEFINIPALKRVADPSGSHIVITGIGTPVPANLGTASYTDSTITFNSLGTPGEVSFTYYVCSTGAGKLCDSGSVKIFIQDCIRPVLDTIYDTTLINTPVTVCIATHVLQTTGSWNIGSLCTAQNGTVEISGQQCFVYNPSTGFFGNDTFCVVVCDSVGCDTTEAIITVIDTLIKAVPISCDVDSTIMGTPVTINELANDIIPLASDTTVVIKAKPQNGTAVVNDDHTITFTPDSAFTGSEEFSYQVCAITGSYKYCDTASICVTVVDTTHRCFIPNAFSPNGDGTNDVYIIPCNDNYPAADIKIYDRWGMEVWASDGHYLNNWDGRNQQGVKLPDGTYYIIYHYNDHTGKNEAKFVVISR